MVTAWKCCKILHWFFLFFFFTILAILVYSFNDSTFTNIVQPSQLSSSRTLLSPQKYILYLLSNHYFPLLTIPWQLIICFLSLHIVLFWILHIDGVIHLCSLLCLASCTLYIFSKSMHVVSGTSTSFLFMVELYSIR